MGIKTDFALLQDIDGYIVDTITRVKERVYSELDAAGYTLEEIYKHGLFDQLSFDTIHALIYMEAFGSMKLAFNDITDDREGNVYDLVLKPDDYDGDMT